MMIHGLQQECGGWHPAGGWLTRVAFALLFVSPLAADNATSLMRQSPLRFEENRGQAPAEFRYVARTAAYSVGLSSTGDELWLAGTGVRMRLLGASRASRPEPEDRMAAVTNYMIGGESRWHTGVPNFERILYRSVYPGVDLVFYARQNRLEHDFVIQPGSDPTQVRFEIAGANSVRIDSSGDLVIGAGHEEVRWKQPEIYQGSENGKQRISGGFVRHGRAIGFHVGSYNRRLPLTIDPVLEFSTYFGGTAGDGIRGIAVDAAGNIYVSGSTASRNLATTGAAFTAFGGRGGNLVPIGDAFVAKFSPAGTLVYLTYLGGNAEDAAGALAVDTAGNVYVTGFTASRDFPVTSQAAQTKFGGGGGNAAFALGDAFIAKIGPAGDNVIYATYLGGFQDDYADAIAIDSAGNAYIAGGTQSQNFPVTPGVFQSKFGGLGGQPGFPRLLGLPVFVSGDAFVAKLSPDGSKFLFVTYLGGKSDDTPFAIAVDRSSNIYVAGATLSTDFPTTAGALQTRYGGADTLFNVFFNVGDGFIAKLNPTGTSLVYSTYLGGAGDDGISSLALDAAGNVYVTGVTTSMNFPASASALQRAYQGPFTLPIVYDQLMGDAFVAKLDSSGSRLAFFTYLGGESDDVGMAIALDPGGNIAVAGITQSTRFPITLDARQAVMAGAVPNADDALPGATSVPQGGGGDMFFVVLDPGGTRLLYGTYLGGKGNDAATGLGVDAAGKFYLSGITQSLDFPTTSTTTPATTTKVQQAAFAGGDSDSWIARFSAVASLNAITNAASNVPGTAPGVAVPGMIFVGYGSLIGPAALAYGGVDAQGKRVTSVSGEQIFFDGIPAPIYYVSASQVAGWVPYELAGKTSTQVTVQYNGQTTAPLTVPVAAADPGLFSANFSGSGQAAALNDDGSFNSSTAPAGANSTVVLFGTGEGQTTPPGVNGQTVVLPLPQFSLPTSATIAGLPASIAYAGPAPGQTEGFSQWNLVVPPGTPPGNQPVVVVVGTFRSQPGLTIAVK